MARKNGPFEDVFPIENGDFPATHVSLPECNSPGGDWNFPATSTFIST